MVWILSPTNPTLGLSKYHFTSPGTYKVGRKDCAIIIKTDKTVSRLHAEIQVADVELKSLSDEIANIPRRRIILRDLSKFGSFVNKVTGSKPVFSLPNKEAILKDGDLITFGTTNCTFRLEYLSLLLHIGPLIDQTRKDTAVSAVTSVGGHIVEEWCGECTHLVVEDGSSVTDVVIQAVAERKPVIGTGWIEAVAARSSPSSEFPSLSRFTPSLSWEIDGDAKVLKIPEPEIRGTAFKGYTFYVASMYLYAYKELIKLLVEASGGVVVAITEMPKYRASQEFHHELNRFIIVPSLEPKLQRCMSSEDLQFLLHVPRTSEERVVAAALAGQIDNESLQIPASPVVSSSTDETVDTSNLEDHDDEVVSAPQVVGQATISGSKSAVTTRDFLKTSRFQSTVERALHVKTQVIQHEAGSHGLMRSSMTYRSAASLVVNPLPVSKEPFKGIQKCSHTSMVDHPEDHVQNVTHIHVNDESVSTLENAEDSKADIYYSKDLIVRKGVEVLKADSSADPSVQNFKSFRKKHALPGNSFTALVPFAREPYRESDYGKEVQEYMQQEKKRKEAEALAEDLFNAEKLKRQKGAAADVATRLAASSSQQKHAGRIKAR